MPTTTDIPAIQELLRHHGGTVLDGPDGKKLFIVLSRNLGLDAQGILVSYEGGGTIYWTLDRAINVFRLVKAGFSMKIAPALSELINALLTPASPTTYDPPRLAYCAAP